MIPFLTEPVPAAHLEQNQPVTAQTARGNHQPLVAYRPLQRGIIEEGVEDDERFFGEQV